MVKPLAGYVLIEREKEKEIGGIEITYDPNKNHTECLIGKVLDVGSNLESPNSMRAILNCQVKKGDKVIYKQFGGRHLIREEGKEYELIEFDNLVGVIK